MKKLSCFSIMAVLFFGTARADHITGGEMFYTYKGSANGVYNYHVTLKLFMRCNSGRQFSNPTIVSVFDKGTTNRVTDLSVPLSRIENLNLANAGPCISNPPVVCYEVGYYEFDVSLPSSANGYVLASQVNFRIAGINNLGPNYGLIGALYTTDIPGNTPDSTGPVNNSAHFTGSDLVVVCANNSFSYSFAAEDKDGDQLRYTFCNAYQSTGGGGNGNGGNSIPVNPPPFPPVPYAAPDYSGNDPLGNNVQINPGTGLITGIAPKQGIYVVTVCVDEIRKGKVIATQRKDLQINIADCSIAAASLLPEYLLCRSTRTLSLSNLSSSPLIQTHDWEIRTRNGTLLYQTASAAFNFTFPDTGIYQIKLVINRGQQCSDSSVSVAKVYPGFVPDFDATGICILNASHFTDKTSTVYGNINGWSWDFGEPGSFTDTSNARNPVYAYPSTGIKTIRLTVSNSLGCKDTATRTVNIIDKPPISLLFRDSLICTPDAIQLQASGPGNFSWSPNINIASGNSPTPTVSPSQTTRYYVDLDTAGCRNRDSVLVRVVDHVSLQMMNDTSICQGDTIQLHIVSDGFVYAWTPAGQIDNPASPNPLAVTTTFTTYRVTAHIGSCFSTGQVNVRPIPYPLVNAGADTIICFNSPASLHGFTNGSTFHWSPAVSLSNPSILNPVANPASSTRYLLTALDTLGCPKPASDEIFVTVLPKIIPFAGHDTAVIVGQPLQLQAGGGVVYRWSPADNLSSSTIPDPIAVFNAASPGLKYQLLVFNEAGCVDTAYINIKVFQTQPEVFVPNAFTPNNDGHNDIIRPIAVGIQKMEYFNIYNRWGQLIFSTQQNGYGWDGRVSGEMQEAGTYVWMVKAVDYKGQSYFNKGIFVLVR